LEQTNIIHAVGCTQYPTSHRLLTGPVKAASELQ